MFLAAFVIGIMAVGLFVSAREVAQFGQRREAWLRVSVGTPLMIAALAALWLGLAHPNLADIRHDDGLGSG